MWNFSSQKESANNHHWRPGSLGAGYITAPTNTPDSFDLLNMDVNTWVIGPDQTQDVHREYMRSRPVTPILFQFYISPTGGIHDGGKGFKNRTGRPVKAVIQYLHRLDNRLYDGHDEIKINRLSGVEKEATIRYKDLARGQVPPGMNEAEAQGLMEYIQDLMEGLINNRQFELDESDIKKVVPWLINQIKNKELKIALDSGHGRLAVVPFNYAVRPVEIYRIAQLFNSKESPWLNKLAECGACNGTGENEDLGICNGCNGKGVTPTGAKADISKMNFRDANKRASWNWEWEEEKKEMQELKERVGEQKTVYEFSGDKKGWYVTRMNPDADEARFEGLSQGNCFQSETMPYQEAVENGRLTVYVLRDPEGRGHALWGYNPDGSVAVMEDSSKMYNQPGSGWNGYRINNDWIRRMVTEANTYLGLDDYYADYNPSFEEEMYLPEYTLQEVTDVDEFFRQYDGETYPDILADEELEGTDERIGEDTNIYRGAINWSDVAYDFFNIRRPISKDRGILSQITMILVNNPASAPELDASDFDNFIAVFQEKADLEREDNEELKAVDIPDAEIQAWDEWAKLNTNPYTGEIVPPRDATEYGYPYVAPTKTVTEEENPWSFDYPSGQQMQEWSGMMPASIDPEIRRGRPSTEEEKTTCFACRGTGKHERNGYVSTCGFCQGTGETEAQKSFPSYEERQKGVPKGEPIPAPAAWVREDPTGQLFFAKKKLWNMTPLSFADQLKDHVASIEPKISHSLSWVKGGKGRGLMLNDGTLVTWPVNKKGEPQHPDMYEYLTGTKLPPAFLPEHFTEGTPFDINEDGTLAFFSNDVPADLISDLSKIDYRLKVSKVANWENNTIEFLLPIKAWMPDKMTGESIDPAHKFIWLGPGVYRVGGMVPDGVIVIDEDGMDWIVRHDDWQKEPEYLPNPVVAPELVTSKVKQFTKEDAIELLEKNNWDFDANEFFMGMNDELEHDWLTHGDPETTAKIVADHLKEHPDYYSRLHKTFKKSKINHKFDFHFNPFTGEPCTCGYNYVFHANHKQASQSVRKIKNQKQKFLQGDQGQAILDYLHRLISGFGMNEQGDFGHGDFPGLEGMVPWIIKQIKTGYIRPFFDENGACTRLNSFYGSEDYAKRDVAERLQARPLLVVGNDEPIKDLIEDNKESGWSIVSNPNTPDIGFAWCNNNTMSPRDLETLAAALPEDATIYLTQDTTSSIANVLENDPEYEEFSAERNAGYAPLTNFTDKISRDIKTPSDFGGSERHAFGRGLSLCKNRNPDLSKISMSQLPDRHFTVISFDDWANWFNANNAPARRGRTKDQIRGALNRATKQIEYRNLRNPDANYDTELVGNNALLIALLADELKVDSGDLTRIVLNFESDGLNKIIDELDKYYTANIDEMGVERVNALSNQHRKYLQELQEIENLKEMFEGIKEDSVVYRVQDPAFKGWTVNRIRDREEAEMESQVLGHCIGDDSQNYVYAIDDGRIEAFSLRDPNGIPKLTWHYNPDGTLAHIQGKSGDSYQLFRHIVTEFNSEEGRDDAGGGAGSEDDLNPGETYWQLNDPTTMAEWIEQKDDPWTIAQEEAERAGERLAEECEIDGGSAQWHDIAEDFIESDDYDQCMTFLKYLTMYGGGYDMRRFAEAMRNNLAEHNAYYAENIEEDPNSKYKDTIDLFNSWALANTTPETGELRSPKQIYDEQTYNRVREEVRQSMGDDAANAMLPYKSLPDILGISQDRGGFFGGKYLPAMFDPRLQKTDLAPEVCTACKGSGYVYAPVRVRSSTDETRYELIKCDRCQGTGKFTDVPAEPDIASMPVQGNPMEYMEMETPEIPQPETQRRTMWCHFCTGRGGGRVMVPDEDGEGGHHPEWKPCEQCNGTGQLKFIYEASLSTKEKAEAWDKPSIQLTAAQKAYIDSPLLVK